MPVSQERTITPVQVGRGSASDSRRVLVVEPQASTRGLMQFGLVRGGFQVTSVRTAEEGERVLAQGPPPALVVSETRLPGLDGVTFCARLRRSSLAEVPVLLLTTQRSESVTAQALSAGAHDVLAKPLFVGDLVTLARLESSRAPASPTLVASTREVPIAAALRALLAGTRSGRLVLGTSAELLFRGGEVVSATVRSIQGERALRRMLFLGEGAYAVHLGSVRTRGELSVDLRALCGPWSDALAAWRSLVRVSVPLEAVLCPDLRALLAQIAQLPEEVEPVVRLFDGERTVRAVVLESSLPESLVLQVTNRLYASGALLPARVARARGLEPMPHRVRTGWDDPSPRTSTPGATPAVPWSTGQTPTPSPALAPTVAQDVVVPPGAAAPGGEPSPPAPATPELPGVAGWGSPSGVGEIERAMRAVPLGLEPLPPSSPRVETPTAVPAAPRTTAAAASAPPPLHRPPTPPSVPMALEAGEESPLAVAARQVALAHSAATLRRLRRQLPLAGLAVVIAAFVATTVWVRTAAPPRPPAGVPGRPAVETEVDRLVARAMERIDARDDAGAEEAAMRAAAIDPSDARAHLLLARIYLRGGRAQQARAALERVLSLEPSGPRADEARALLSSIP